MTLSQNLILDIALKDAALAKSLADAQAVPVMIRTTKVKNLDVGMVTLADPKVRDGLVQAFSFRSCTLVPVPANRVALLAD